MIKVRVNIFNITGAKAFVFLGKSDEGSKKNLNTSDQLDMFETQNGQDSVPCYPLVISHLRHILKQSVNSVTQNKRTTYAP